MVRRVLTCLVLSAALLTTGCASVLGEFFQLVPDGHVLMHETKKAMQSPGCSHPLPRELCKVPAVPYLVEPGDVLLIQPANLDSPIRLPGDQPVLADGTIDLGVYGRLPVAGKTLDEIAVDVRCVIERQIRDPGAFTVQPVTRESKVFYVLGEVNAPGAFVHTGRETVLDAILLAGGLTEKAGAHKVILSRPTSPEQCRVVMPVCYPEIVQLGDTTTNYQIQAGDRVYVPTRNCWDDLLHRPTR